MILFRLPKKPGREISRLGHDVTSVNLRRERVNATHRGPRGIQGNVGRLLAGDRQGQQGSADKGAPYGRVPHTGSDDEIIYVVSFAVNGSRRRA